MQRLIIVLIACLLQLNAHAFDAKHKPDAAPSKWTGYFGEFISEDQKILVREKDGQLQLLLNPTSKLPAEKLYDQLWSLNEISPGKYTSTLDGVTQNFIFRSDSNGKARSLIIDNDVYARNPIEPADGNTFKVTLKNGIEPLLNAALKASPPDESGKDFLKPDLVDVTKYVENVKLDVRYAGTNNFLSAPTYSQAKSFLQRPAAVALQKAAEKLEAMGYGILVHDAYRPWYVTKIFWDATSGPERDFVADPARGSIHNRGSAIDLTLYELETGKVIKMVGTYDEMSERSYPDYQGGTSLERWHRDLLRSVMESVGFSVYDVEWWHFDYKDWEKYPVLNETFEKLSLND